MAELGDQHLPNEPEARICLANILHDRSEYAAAEVLYRQVLAVAPDHPGALHNFGNTMHAIGHVAESVALIDRAVAAAPDPPEFHFSLAAAPEITTVDGAITNGNGYARKPRHETSARWGAMKALAAAQSCCTPSKALGTQFSSLVMRRSWRSAVVGVCWKFHPPSCVSCGPCRG